MLEDPDYAIAAFSVSDQFGDYGVTGMSIMQIENSTAIIDSLLMSCRVIGRNLEIAFFDEIVKFLLEHRNFGGKIPEEVQKIFKDVCVNMADSDFRAIEQNALISCYEIAAILDAKLQELHEKQSSAIAEQESFLERRQQNIAARRTSLPQDLEAVLEASKQLVTALTAQQGSVLSAEQLSLLKNLSSGLNSSINRLPTEDGLRASEEALVQERLAITASYDQIPQLQKTLSELMNNILDQRLFSELSQAGHQRT
jgi:predicted enzyme involved in methoxymalonyl-ACP biosynthesis